MNVVWWFMNVLIVDAMPLVYSNFAKVGSLAVQAGPNAGTPTGLRYGFLRSVNSYRKRTQADKVVIAWDSAGPVKKAEGAEDIYKANRSDEIELGLTDKKVDKTFMYAQIPDLKEMIGLTSWVQLELAGYEADDLIGHYARELSRMGHAIVISSTDNDLCQVVSEHVKIFVPNNPKQGRKKDSFKDLDWVRAEFGGLEGNQVTLYRAIMGDKSDNLPGVLGLSQMDFSSQRDLIRACIKQTKAQTPGQVVTALLEGGASQVAHEIDALMDKFELMYNIMRLHSPDAPVRVRKGVKDQTLLKELFEKLEFKSMMKEIEVLCT